MHSPLLYLPAYSTLAVKCFENMLRGPMNDVMSFDVFDVVLFCSTKYGFYFTVIFIPCATFVKIFFFDID